MSNREEQHSTTENARPSWTAPTVRRMAAGSAEDGADPSPDGGAFPS
ncbi:MAG TPA: hypothetical protein VF577_00285 [Allosphingosinicella sp.]|jgi:hypothetical protein